MCAVQIASGSGDMRRALESCSRAFATLCQDAASAQAERAVAMDTSGECDLGADFCFWALWYFKPQHGTGQDAVGTQMH